MKKLIPILFLCLSTCDMLGQEVKGTVTDTNGRPLEYANVILLSADSSYISGCVTDINGHFAHNKGEAMMVRVSYLGHETKTLRFQLPDTIKLAPTATMIGDVVVKGTRNNVKHVNRGISVSIENSPLSKIGDASECLKQLPLIDASNGSINVIGKGTPQIYIDKRLVRNMSELNTLSSGDIKNVEIVTNPPAKYGADVTSVILITTKKQSEGLAATVKASVTASEEWSEKAETNLNYHNSKGLTLFGDISYSWDGFKQKRNYTELFNEGKLFTNTDAHAKSRSQSLMADGGFNFDLDKISLGAKYIFTRTPRSEFTSNAASQTNARNGLGTITSANTLLSDNHRHYVNGYVDVTLSQNSNLRLDVDYINGASFSASEVDEQEAANTVSNSNNTSYNLFASKLELTKKFHGNVETNVGVEYSHTENNQDFHSHSTDGSDIASDTRDDVEQALLGAWISMDWNINKRWSAFGGLRYENVKVDYDQNYRYQSSMSPTYSDFFPNVGIRYSSPTTISLHYKRTTSRPSYSLLDNSYVYVTPTLWETGNPSLQSSISDDIGINVSYKKTYVQATLSFNHRNHASIYTYNDARGVNIRQEQQLPDFRSLSFVVVQRFDVGFWHPTLQGVAYMQDLEYAGKKFDKSLWQLAFNNRFDLPLGCYAYVNVFVLGKGNSDVIYSHGTWQTSLTLSKQIKNWSFTLSANDMFATWRQKFATMTNGVEYTPTIKGASQMVSLSVKYNLNEAKGKYKGNKAVADEIKRL